YPTHPQFIIQFLTTAMGQAPDPLFVQAVEHYFGSLAFNPNYQIGQGFPTQTPGIEMMRRNRHEATVRKLGRRIAMEDGPRGLCEGCSRELWLCDDCNSCWMLVCGGCAARVPERLPDPPPSWETLILGAE